MTVICTRSGVMFDLLKPDPKDVRSPDIARALGGINRFNSHAGCYSVAEHCVLASHLVSPDFALAALLHDAQEAYTGDISTPMKQAIGGDVVNRIEAAIHRAICLHLGVSSELPEEVLEVDSLLVHFEACYLWQTPPAWVESDKVFRCEQMIDARGLSLRHWGAQEASRQWYERLLNLCAIHDMAI